MKEIKTMKRLFFIAIVLFSALLFCSATKSFAQNNQTSQTKTLNFNEVEEKPQFQELDGTPLDFAKWIAAHIQYPEIARENGIQGRVIVRFTIDIDGSIKNVKVLRGVDSALDKEALRVISSSPKWKPGKHNGQLVSVSYVFPVIFKLQ